MTKLIKLDKDSSIKIRDAIEEYLISDYIYIPLPPKRVELKKETNLRKGSLLYPNMYAPVSGKLVGLEECLLPSGKKANCLVLENDFQEKMEIITATRKKINTLSKEEVLNSIFNTELKNKLEKEEVVAFVISGIDDEPYIENESFIQRKQTKAIVDTLEALLNLFPNSKAYIALKNIDNETIVNYQSILGMFKNIEIKLLEDLYLIGKEEFLLKYLHIKNNYVYLKASEVYELYINIKKRRPLFEKVITINGNGTQKPLMVKARLGVKVIDIFKKYYHEDLSDCSLYVNGMMQGVQMDINKLIVTRELDGIILMKKQKRHIKNCVKCGKCISICPIHSNPLLAYKLGMKVKCIGCGLCTYICPSYIPLHKYLNGDKNE